MALEKYRDWKPKPATYELIETCMDIIDEYMYDGYTLTLRQLYYQLVARDVIPNTERSYKQLGTHVTRARLAGLIDWDAIEDRARRPHKHPEWEDLGELVEDALRSYRRPRWEFQTDYAELWVEKDALASVLRPLADEYHVTLMVNRGYSSASAMKQSADRLKKWTGNRVVTVFYLGDLDPSGEDMVRDIRTRLDEFCVGDIDVQKIALTYEQVQEHQPPPNPAKLTDPRAAAFVAKYGGSSWEVDALPPAVLSQIIRSVFDEIIDTDAMDVVVTQEKLDKQRLRAAVASLMEE